MERKPISDGNAVMTNPSLAEGNCVRNDYEDEQEDIHAELLQLLGCKASLYFTCILDYLFIGLQVGA